MVDKRSPWRRADVVLALIVTIFSSVACLALTLSLSGTGLDPLLALVATVCTRTFSETIAHRADLGRLLVFLPLGVGLALAIFEALRLLHSTWRRMSMLAPLQRAPSKRLFRLMNKCGLGQHTVFVQFEPPLIFTHGLFRPKVWLSTGLMRLLSDDELEAVLRHEDHHLEAFDPLKILVARCLSRALFFVPVARDLCETYAIAKEVAADAHATRAMDDALPLARALHKLIAGQPISALNAAFVGETNVTEARLLALLDPAHPLPLLSMKHLGLSLLWLLVFAAVLLAPAAGHMPSFTECAAPSAFSLLGHWPL